MSSDFLTAVEMPLFDSMRSWFRKPARRARVMPVEGIVEGRRWTEIPATAGRFAAWKPRPPRSDIHRGVGVVKGGYCSVSGDIYDDAGMRLWNLSHKQRARRNKSWIKEKIISHHRCCASGERIDAPIVNLTASTSAMYFHWMIDVLPRYFVASESGLAEDRLIYASSGRPYQDETLRALEVQGRVIDADETPLEYSDDIAAPCHQLACGYLPPQWVLGFLNNELFTKLVQKKSKFGRRIYVSRNDAARRHLLNEKAVLAALAPLEFEKVTPGQLSVEDQLAAFAGADIIVGAHGSGLANVAFCKPGTVLIELFSNTYFDDGPYRLSQAAGMDYYYVRERVPHASGIPVRTSYEVEPCDVLGTLEFALNSRKSRVG
jgi:hypothetical protein